MSIQTDDIARSEIEIDHQRTMSRTSQLYRVVWRWHFYTSLFMIAFLLILAITGIVYLFKPQLDRLKYFQQVQPVGTALPYAQQLAAVNAVYSSATVSGVVMW